VTDRVAVYTAIFGGRDVYAPPLNRTADAFLFTDAPHVPANGERVVEMRVAFDGPFGPRRTARLVKICGHPLLSGYDICLWMDGSFDPGNADLSATARKALADADMAAFRHPARSCAYQEAAMVKRLRYDRAHVVSAQMERYRKDGFPENFGLVQTGFLAWRSSSLQERFRLLWWKEVSEGSIRDQLSFMYCAWKTGACVASMPWSALKGMGIVFRPHAVDPKGIGPESRVT